MTFADFEARIRDELDRMLGPADFPARATSRRSRSTAGRTATATWRIRCSIRTTTTTRCCKLARQRSGRVAIANSDAGGDA